MRKEKDKNLTALLAFFGGVVGLQRFYLGQKGLGFLMIFLAIFTMGVVSSIIGVIDAILFLTMSNEKFDYKYNNPDEIHGQRNRRPRYKSYERRYSSRENTIQKDSSQRRDRRMSPYEYQEGQTGHDRKSSGPYRRTTTRRGPKNSKRQRKVALKKIDELKTRGIEKFKDFDIEGSVQEFKRILEIDPHHIAANFNLACAYSQLEKPQKAMAHISRAVKSGFDDFERIRKHGKLAYARIQPEWEDFEKNGFLFDSIDEAVSRETNEDQQVSTNLEEKTEERDGITEEEKTDLLEHLNILKQQREKGIISETEFELERRKLMSS